MGSSHLDSLAVELQTKILRQISSLRSLYNLIRASPRCFQVFRSSKEVILNQIIRRVVGREVFYDAVFLAEALHLTPKGLDGRSARALMRKYVQDAATFPYDKPLSSSTLAHLCRLHPIIEFHLENIRNSALNSLVDCAQAMGTKPTTKTFQLKEEHSEVDRLPLSTVETVRLHRALYRTELYGVMFYLRPSFAAQTQRLTSSEQDAIFLAAFSPWEVEEMACIWFYFQSRLGECFERLEDNFVRLAQDHGPSSGYSKTDEDYEKLEALMKLKQAKSKVSYDHGNKAPKSEMDSFFDAYGPHRFFTCAGKSHGHEDLMEILFSLGLSFLRDLFEVDDQQQMRMVLDNAERSSQSTFVNAYNIHNANIDTNVTQWPQEQDYDPDPDSFIQPGAGYHWARKAFSHEMGSFPCRHRGGLRSLGYVFWDKARLDASGIFGHP